MRKIFVIFIVLFSFKLAAQTPVDYQYDNAGNRIARYKKNAFAPNPVPSLAAENKPQTALVDKTKALELQGEETLSVAVSPNPGAGVFIIHLSAPTPDGWFELYDAAGRPVWSQSAEFYSATMDITREAPGAYVLILRRAGRNVQIWNLIKI